MEAIAELKRKILFSIGLIASVIFLYLSFRKIDYFVFVEDLTKISIVPILLSLVCTIFTYLIRAIRWKYILVDPNLKFSTLFSASMIGNMGNNIFPMRIGELIRCYVLGYQENMSKSRILASVMFERVLDGITVLLFFTVSLIFTNIENIFFEGSIIAFFAFSFILMIMIISKNYQESFFKIFSYIFYFFPDRVKVKLSNITSSFLTGLDIINNKKNFSISIIYSLIFWGVSILGTYFVLLSTNNNIPVDLPIILISALVVGVMIPSAPGFIGTYHYVVILILGLYGWDKETSASMSVILHGIQFIIPIIIGLFLLTRLGYSFRSLIDINNKLIT